LVSLQENLKSVYDVRELEKILELKVDRKISNFINTNSIKGYNRKDIIGCILSESLL